MKKLILFNLILLLLSWSLNAQEATVPEGSGTLEDPYKIASLKNLYWLSTNSTAWDKHIVQIADIDASSTTGWDAGGWSPIGDWWANSGTEINVFSGNYDGQGHTISGLYVVKKSDFVAFGLFGRASGATIKNLGIINVNFENSDLDYPTGALVGSTNNCIVDNCFSSGFVSGIDRVGGLAGDISGASTISNCYSSCNVTGKKNVGGLVGMNNINCLITDSYYTSGTVDGSSFEYSSVGGLVGACMNASISKCRSTGTVIGYSTSGGLVGSLNYSNVSDSYSRCNINILSDLGFDSGGLVGYNAYESTITNCYSTGSGGVNTGGLVGMVEQATTSNSYWDTETSGITTISAGGEGKTTDEMIDKSTYSGWDFTEIWGMNSIINDGYPHFQTESSPCPGSAVAIDFETGVTNSGNSLGQPDNNVAILYYEQGGQLTLDLTGEGGIIAPGNTITVLWRKNSVNNPLVGMELTNAITGSWETVIDEYYVEDEYLTGYSFTVTADTRYLSILIDGTEGEILEIDAVTYTCSCTAPTPIVSVENFCGYSVLTASDYTGALTWNTGETTESITVNVGGIYSVSQKVGECLSLSGSGLAEPYVVPGNPGPISGPDMPCEGTAAVYSINPVNEATGYTWSVPTGWSITAGQNTVSITVTVGPNTGNVTVKAISTNCESTSESVKSVIPDTKCCWPDQPDRYEDNNTLQTAKPVSVGGALIWANILNPKDVDWFYFLTGDAGLYKINLAGAGESFELCNNLGRKLKPTGRTETTYNLLDNKTYYIKISSRVKVPADCYSLGVEFQSAGLFVTEQYDELKSAKITPTSDGIFRIWPNPTKNEFELYNGTENPVQVRVMDVIGRTIETIENVGIGETVVFGSKYKSGIYFVETVGNGTQKVFKLVKQ